MAFNFSNGGTSSGMMGGGNPLSSLFGGSSGSGGGWQNLLMSGGDPMMSMMMGGGQGGMMGMLDPLGMLGGLFGGGSNPADAAMPYLNQGQGVVDKYMNPYIAAGQQAMPALQQQYSQLINNPSGMMNKIGSGFQQSPGYQFQVDQASGAANRAAAAGGMLGSPMQQQNISGTVNNMANQDYYNYLNHGMSMYGQGLSGMQHMGDMGLQASTTAEQSMMDLINTQAQLAYAGKANQNQSQNGMFGSLMSLAPLAMAFL